MTGISILRESRRESLDQFHGRMPWLERLRAFRDNPSPQCFLLLGSEGAGKSEAARALACDLGTDPAHSGDWVEFFPQHLAVDSLRGRVAEILRYSPMGRGWKVVVFEEASRLSAESLQALKILLDPTRLPDRTVVLVISNDRELWLDPARRALVGRRLHVLDCDDGGDEDPESLCQEALCDAWHEATGLPGELCPLSAAECRHADGTLTIGRALNLLQHHLETGARPAPVETPTEVEEWTGDEEGAAPEDIQADQIERAAEYLGIPPRYVAAAVAQYRKDAGRDTRDDKYDRVATYLRCLESGARPSLRSVACQSAVSFEFARSVAREIRPDLTYVS
jgi:hypothetical protein